MPDYFVDDPMEAMKKCSWCGGKTKSKGFYSVPFKSRIKDAFKGYEGMAFEMTLKPLNKKFVVFLAGKNSAALKEGKDGSIIACSLECSHKIGEALSKEENFK